MHKPFNPHQMNLNYPKYREWLTLRGYSSATAATILGHVTEFSEWAEKVGLPELPGLTCTHLMTYVQACQQRGVVQKAIAHYIAELRKLFDFLISEGVSVDNPAAFIKLRLRSGYITTSFLLPKCNSCTGDTRSRSRRSLEEFQDWRTQNATSKEDKKGLRYAPFCFTEQGVTMLSCVLNSERAITVNIRIMRIFQF